MLRSKLIVGDADAAEQFYTTLGMKVVRRLPDTDSVGPNDEGARHASEPGKYLPIEIYRDVAGFEDHKAKDYFKIALSEIGPLAARAIVNRYETYTA